MGNEFLFNSYGYNHYYINDLKKVSFGKAHYNYKGVDFFYNKKTDNGRLVIAFHAAVNVATPLPVFRGHDWDLKNTNVLAISDSILKKYREHNKSKIVFDATFFLNTKHQDYNSIYYEIIKDILKDSGGSDSVFFGTSAGGLGALIFGSLFESVVVLGNSQFYIDKWWNIENSRKTINKVDGNDIVVMDVEDFLINNQPPRKLVIFTNTKDDMCYDEHHVPMINFFKKKFPANISVVYHSERWTKKYHTTHFPSASPYLTLLEGAHSDPKPVKVLTDDVSWAYSKVHQFNNVLSDIEFLPLTLAEEKIEAYEDCIIITLLQGNSDSVSDRIISESIWIISSCLEYSMFFTRKVHIIVNDEVIVFDDVCVLKPDEKNVSVSNG